MYHALRTIGSIGLSDIGNPVFAIRAREPTSAARDDPTPTGPSIRRFAAARDEEVFGPDAPSP